MSFKVKHIQGEKAGLIKKDGSVWSCPICTRCDLKIEDIEQALQKGCDVEAEVKFRKNHPAVVTDFEVVSSSLEDQQREYEMLGGEY